MFQQRAQLASSTFRVQSKLWRPAVPLVGEREVSVAPHSSDVYLVVDDMAEGSAIVASSPWPRVDRAGRLVFGEPERRGSAGFEIGVLFEAIRAQRRRSAQLGPDRELRVGDAFLVRGYGPVEAPNSPGAWRAVWDVTRDARSAARAAYYSAVAPTVDEDDPRAASLLGREPQPTATPTQPAPGHRAAPAV